MSKREGERMVGFNGVITCPSGHVAQHRDGRRASQVTFCVQASSQRAVAELLRTSVHWVAGYTHKTLNDEMIQALSNVPPGTLMIKPLDPAGSLDGQDGWVPR